MKLFMIFLSPTRNMATNADFRIFSFSFRYDTVEIEVLTALLDELEVNILIVSTSCPLSTSDWAYRTSVPLNFRPSTFLLLLAAHTVSPSC